MAKSGKSAHFSVGRSDNKGVFRDVHTGKFVTRVMSKRVFDQATERADTKIREYAASKKRS